MDFIQKEWIAPCNDQCSFCFLNYSDVLQKNYLFKGLGKDEIGRIVKNIRHQAKKYAKDEILAYSGDAYNRLYIIMEGSVVGEIVDFEGKVLRIEELSAPDAIAPAFLFGDSNRLPVNVTASSDTRVLIIPREDLLQLLRKNEKVLENYLNSMSNREIGRAHV